MGNKNFVQMVLSILQGEEKWTQKMSHLWMSIGSVQQPFSADNKA